MKRKISTIGVCVLTFAVVLGTITLMRLTGPGATFLNPVGDVMNGVLSPVEGFLLRVSSGIGDTVSSLVAFHGARRENEILRQSVGELTAENALLREQLAAAEWYGIPDASEALAPFWDQYAWIGASVVSRGQDSWYQTIKINRGRRHGVALNAPVVTGAGLVGKVVSVTETTAQVLMLTDAQGQASSFVRQREGEPVYGVVCGTYGQGSRLHSDGELRMDFRQEDDVAVGDPVLTSGLGGVFPKGIMIGTVTEVLVDSSGMMKRARVKAAVNFDALEEVRVIRMPAAEG